MLQDLKKIQSVKSSIKHIPENPGIYVFWNDSTPIYIGKAKNLRKRLSSYFLKVILEKTAEMIRESKSISFIEVGSEVEALLLEADLVWNYQPKYNRALKDDKHPLYIIITSEQYPRVLAAKRSDLVIPHKKVFGPFPSTGNLRFVLRLLRPIFPYANHKPLKKPCLYSQMGLCDPCPSLIESADRLQKNELKLRYAKNIRYINGVLSGSFKRVRMNLVKEMDNLSKNQKYEEASDIREKLRRLDYITSPSTEPHKFIENPNLIDDLRAVELKELKTLISHYRKIEKLERIECYDVAHLAGSNPTASGVTFIGGEADKSLYRHYRIKNAKKADDISSLREIALRRSKRLEDWGKPDLIIVDGGRGQVGVFYDVFIKHGVYVVGLAKKHETLVIPVEGQKISYKLVRPRGPALFLIQRIRDEAHRFARRYHHKLVKNYLSQTAESLLN